MGLDINGVSSLLYARINGVDFTKTAMIGRQHLDIGRRGLKSALQTFGYVVNDELIEQIFTKSNGYAEKLLTYLGARDVHSFDISAYEGATHLFDMNKEVPAEVKEQYTTVLDSGSLEHVFNFPVAIKNCMEMVKVGGHYIGITPANNLVGHGFYQFSPETYFSIFTKENGFELVNIIAFEDRPGSTWYSVRNPKEVRGRVTLVNYIGVYLLVVAKRLTKAIIFETTPQQSDYITVWHQNNVASDGVPRSDPKSKKWDSQFDGNKDWIKRNMPALVLLKRLFKVVWYSISGFDPRFFRPLDPTLANSCSTTCSSRRPKRRR